MSKRIKAQEDDLTVPATPDPDLEAPDVPAPSAPKGTKLEAILALRKRGFSLAECGKQLGVSKQACGQLLRRSGVDVEAVEAYKRDKDIIFNAKQKVLVDALTPKVVSKMSGRDLLIGTGILQDKLRDLAGGAATSIISIIAIAQRAEAAQGAEEVANES